MSNFGSTHHDLSALLTTADGQPVFPDTTVYHPNHSLPGRLRSDVCDGFMGQFEAIAAGKKTGRIASYPISECYWNRQAANPNEA